MRPALLLAWLMGLGACASPPPPRAPDVVRGHFGGAHAALVASDTAAAVELDCAHGRTTGPLRVSAGGRFDVAGTLVPGGGPVRADTPPSARPARFVGHLDGETLQFRVLLSDGSNGPYTLRRGTPPLLYKCL
jgi:hypothetical protein